MNAAYLAFGIAFGFLLSRGRATDYNAIAGMFRFSDFHLAGVMAVAIAVAAVGLYVLRRTRARALAACPIEVSPKPAHSRTFLAGLVFGTGWALTGA